VAPILTYIIGGWIDIALSLPRFPPFPINLLVGFGVFFSGLAIGSKSTRRLYREGLGLPWGEAVRETRTSKLVTTGLYAYTRNPMVLGYSMLPCGMGIMFRSPGMAVPITAIVLLVNVILVKTKEEPGHEERFGEEYRAYRRRTPFLIPRTDSLLKAVSFLIESDDEKTEDLTG
jgi:protein-S-isoprenylcysteine O-methyltransferase Ste14